MTHLVAERFVENPGLSFGKARLRAFMEAPSKSIFLASTSGSGQLSLVQKRPTDPLPKLSHSDLLVGLQNGQIGTRLAFPELIDSNTHPLDLTLATTWTIKDTRLFLREFALPLLAAQDTITLPALEAYLVNRLSDWVRDAIRAESYHDLKIDNVNALRWWQEMLPRWIDLDWITLVRVDSATYESPLAERMLECAKQKELMETTQAAMHRQKIVNKERERAEIELQQSLDRIKADATLTGIEQQARAEITRLEHQAALVTAREMSAIAKLEAEKQRAEIEFEIAQIQKNQTEAEALAKASAEAATLASKTMKKLKIAQKEIADTTGILKQAAAEGIEDFKRLAEHTAGVSASTLDITGHATPREQLLAIGREKAAFCGSEVALIKHGFTSRDLAGNRIDALSIGSRIHFTLQTARAGYVSILNIGTSGTVYLLTPNGLVPPRIAKTAAPAMVPFPGPPFFPIDNLWENGPPGWEDMLVIISDEPLFSPADLVTASARSPEVVITSLMMESLISRLQALEPECWSAGLLGFLVVA